MPNVKHLPAQFWGSCSLECWQSTNLMCVCAPPTNCAKQSMLPKNTTMFGSQHCSRCELSQAKIESERRCVCPNYEELLKREKTFNHPPASPFPTFCQKALVMLWHGVEQDTHQHRRRRRRQHHHSAEPTWEESAGARFSEHKAQSLRPNLGGKEGKHPAPNSSRPETKIWLRNKTH